MTRQLSQWQGQGHSGKVIMSSKVKVSDTVKVIVARERSY